MKHNTGSRQFSHADAATLVSTITARKAGRAMKNVGEVNVGNQEQARGLEQITPSGEQRGEYDTQPTSRAGVLRTLVQEMRAMVGAE